MFIYAILAFIVAGFILSRIFTLIAIRVAPRFGFVDIPAGRKAHKSATPLLGGAAIFLGFFIPFAIAMVLIKIWSASGAPEFLPKDIAIHISGAAYRIGSGIVLLVATSMLFLLGLWDDKKALGPILKLAVQLISATLVVWFADVRVITVAGTPLSVLLTILWIVAITNSFNFLDNMDGLTAGVSAICCLGMVAVAITTGQWFVASLGALLAGSVLGFLPANFPPARIFMGDAGSMTIGFLVAILSCQITYVRPGEPTIIYGLMTPLCLLAVPIYDTISVMIIRIKSGANPMVGDRNHFSHRLLKRGMSKRTVALTIYFCASIPVASAIVLTYTRQIVPAVLIAFQVIIILLVIALLEFADSGENNGK